MKGATIVVALGGNALLRRDEPLTAEAQRANAHVAAAAIASLATDNRLVITHGNGPQVGLLALQSLSDPRYDAFPLDVLGAESEGMIGYVLEQELANQLPSGRVATLLTQVEVSSGDPAFQRPTKPIGPVYDRQQADQLAAHRGWLMGPEPTGGYRRLVPSPAPLRVLELDTIKLLLDHRTVVVCGGGGGIPVIATDRGWIGIEAVIDKDATAALIAEALADVLVLLTDVDAVYDGGGPGIGRALHHATPEELRALTLAEGSMGPKVAAACGFVERTGRRAVIGSLQQAAAVVAGVSGTWIKPSHDREEVRQ